MDSACTRIRLALEALDLLVEDVEERGWSLAVACCSSKLDESRSEVAGFAAGDEKDHR